MWSRLKWTSVRFCVLIMEDALIDILLVKQPTMSNVTLYFPSSDGKWFSHYILVNKLVETRPSDILESNHVEALTQWPHFADDIFKYSLLVKMLAILIQIKLKFLLWESILL